MKDRKELTLRFEPGEGGSLNGLYQYRESLIILWRYDDSM